MAFNGSGTFVINSTGQPVVYNTVIDETVFNALTADLATGLTTCLTKDGQSTPTANIPMGGFKITGIAAATGTGDALSYGRAANVTTLTATGALTYGGVTLTNNVTGTGKMVLDTNPQFTNYIGVGQAAQTGYSILVSAAVGSNAVIQATQNDTTATTPNTNLIHAATSGNNVWIQFYSDGGPTLRGSIDYNRAGGAVRYNTTSSETLKTAIVDLPDEKHDALSAVVDDVQLREFEWRDAPGIKTLGIVTEELASIYPDAVNGDGTQYDRSMFVFPLLAKCKGLESRLAELEARLEAAGIFP